MSRGEVGSGQVEEEPHVLVVEPVPDGAPVAPGADHAGGAQEPQRWLTPSRHVDRRRQVADAELAGLGQGEEDPHPAAVAEEPEHHRQTLGLVDVEKPWRVSATRAGSTMRTAQPSEGVTSGTPASDRPARPCSLSSPSSSDT